MKDTWSEFDKDLDEKDFSKFFGFTKHFPVIFAVAAFIMLLIESIVLLCADAILMGVLFLVLGVILPVIIYAIMKISISYNILHIVYLRKLMTMINPKPDNRKLRETVPVEATENEYHEEVHVDETEEEVYEESEE